MTSNRSATYPWVGSSVKRLRAQRQGIKVPEELPPVSMYAVTAVTGSASRAWTTIHH